MVLLGYFNARSHGILSKTLTHGDIQGLLNASDGEELKAVLSATYLAPSINDISDFENQQELLDLRLRQSFAMLLDSLYVTTYGASSNKLIDTFGIKIRSENLKIILRGIANNAPIDDVLSEIIPLHTRPISYYRKLASVNRLDVVMDMVKDKYLRKALLRHWTEYQNTRNLLVLETALDATTFEVLAKHEKFYNVELALRNITTIARCIDWGVPPRRYIIPTQKYVTEVMRAIRSTSVGEVLRTFATNPTLAPLMEAALSRGEGTDALYKLENEINRYLIQRWKNIYRNKTLSGSMVFAFLELKYAETKDIIHIVSGKLSGVDPQRIKDALTYYVF